MAPRTGTLKVEAFDGLRSKPTSARDIPTGDTAAGKHFLTGSLWRHHRRLSSVSPATGVSLLRPGGPC